MLEINANARAVKILFTHHARGRMRFWDLSEKKVLETLLYPEEVQTGHHKRYIAHRCYTNHVLRAVYEYEREVAVLVTVYYPFKKRYFEGKKRYEDKILP